MGIVFGVTGASEPHFDLKSHGNGYDIRSYDRFFVAELNRTTDDDDGFRTLANYIGAFGKPQNERTEEMAMTAPVISDPYTGNSVDSRSIGDNMKFVLPDNFKSIDEIPRPLNNQIQLKECSSQTVAVKQFSGWASQSLFRNKFQELFEELRRDQIIAQNITQEQVKWSSAQYHPPFTLPFLRKNEIWIYLDK
jgi:hypothetical protein